MFSRGTPSSNATGWQNEQWVGKKQTLLSMESDLKIIKTSCIVFIDEECNTYQFMMRKLKNVSQRMEESGFVCSCNL
jgi:hypothetical protein